MKQNKSDFFDVRLNELSQKLKRALPSGLTSEWVKLNQQHI